MIAQQINTLTNHISRLSDNVHDAFVALENKQLTIPEEERVSDNLASYINAIEDDRAIHKALTTWMADKAVDAKDPMQIYVHPDNTEITADRYFANERIVYIDQLYLPKTLSEPYGPVTDYGLECMTTVFKGFVECPRLRYIGQIIPISMPMCYIPPTIVYTWFFHTRYYYEDPAQNTCDQTNALYFGGIANWGQYFDYWDTYISDDRYKDPITHILCLNLACLNLHAKCIVPLINNLYDFVANGIVKAGYTRFDIYLTQQQHDIFDHYYQALNTNYITLANNKGWGVRIL